MRGIVLTILFGLAVGTAQAADGDYVVKTSSLSVSEAAANIEAAIEAAPPKLMAKIDHGANAGQADLELGASVLLILGAPKIGTPIMQANPMAGLDLPAKILVWDDAGQTRIGYLDPAALGKRHDVADVPQLSQMSKALDGITEKGVR